MNRFIYVPLIALAILLLNYHTVHAAGTCDAVTEIPTTECQALTTLYNTTNGPNWTNKSNWLVTDTPCSWYGVTCANGHVTGLDLHGNGLQNSLPAELGNLGQLKALYLNNNGLSGNIPPALGNLSQLSILHLADNQLKGELPITVGNLTSLTYLDLSGNYFTGAIPPQLGNLTQLSYLNLSDGDNYSCNYPYYYCYGNNQFTSTIPSTLGNLTQLTTLDLSNNYLTGTIPSELGNLTKLQNLFLHSNYYLTGSIPTQLGNLTNLQKMYLYSNQLNGAIPTSLGNLSNLRELELSGNRLSGVIPIQLGGLTKLTILSLHSNQLSGSIPTTLGNLINLTDLRLSVNQLSGLIPSELGNLTKLTTLYLNNNQLSSEIPLAITKLTSLSPQSQYSTIFGNNKLVATNNEVVTFLNNKDCCWTYQTVPPTNLLATILANGILQLSWTPITFKLTTGYYEISYASNINGPYMVLGIISNTASSKYQATNVTTNTNYYFKIRTFTPKYNSQQSELWSDYSTPLSFISPTLFNCNLVSEIPQTECQALTALYNQTQGQNWYNRAGWLTTTKPCGWYGLSCENQHVISIYLPNNLSGTIPIELGNLTQLKNLDLGNNRLSGSIPKQISNLTQLQLLALWQNNLTGTIPVELAQLTKLQVLSLAINQLTGPIPPQLGHLISLTHLSLHTNQLSGPIPPELGNLTQMPDLYLHNNQLEGEIPSSIVKMVGLREIHGYNYPYFSYNKLTSSNPEVITFLNKKDPTWSKTQTTPPTKLQALSTTNSNLLLSWQAITYTSDTGYYEISSATSPNGPYKVLGNTASKTDTSYNALVVSGTTYYFKVRTFTAKHDNQQNDLWSDYSTILTITPPIAFNCDTVTEIPTQECQALTKLYQNTKGSRWAYNTGWLSNNQPCQWSGVRCFNGHVTRLELTYRVLSGTLPAELAHLTELTTLNLGNNQLIGSIPSELGQLNKLIVFNTGNNLLSGTIPPELGQLTKLIYLYLNNNQLSGSIPPELGQMTQITNIYLNNNQLSGLIPAELGQLTQLTNLSLNNNQLSDSIPVEIGQLTKLNYLYLNGNQLSSEIPTSITNLTKLSSIDLRYNKLFSTDESVIYFLKNKSFSDWQNYQTLPPTAIKATALTSNTIKLSWRPSRQSYNGYHEISLATTENGPYTVIAQHPNDYNLTSTKTITDLHPNRTYYFKLRNYNPADYNNPNNLWSDYSPAISITLNANTSICDAVSEISTLECQALVALYQNMGGANWSNYNNQWLLSETPCSWSGVACTNGHVTTLNLNSYQLKGILPAQIGDLSYLQLLNLASNSLSGTIPSAIGKLTSLTTLNLSNNQLRGEIPLAITHLTSLPLKNQNATIFGYNKLVATNQEVITFLNDKDSFWTYQTIPPTNLSTTRLTATSIQLTWTPIAYFSYSSFYEISYATNINGPYTLFNPLYNTSSASLQVTNLVANTTYYFKIRTFTPASYYQPNALWSDYSPIIIYPEQQFTNCINILQIPQAECEALTALYDNTEGINWWNASYYNKWLTTDTPCNWTGITCVNGHVITLKLHSYQLKGRLPAKIGNLTYLTSLDLRGNQLIGPIPKEIGNLTQLQTLILVGNRLSGTIPIELGQLTQLQVLSFALNQLSGPIPAQFGNLTNLTELYLNENQLSGSIPTELGNLIRLTDLCLQNNQLGGEIPTSITQLTALQSESLCSSYLSYNKLTSTNPEVIAFLNQKDSTWSETQTIPPTELKATSSISNKILLSWQPISYTANVGYYEISSATSADGVYQVLDKTTDKTVSHYEIPVVSNTTYYFKIRTFSINTGYQLHELWSDYSSVVSITLKPAATNCNEVTQIPVAECQALVSVYNKTQGANWLTHTNWLTFDNPCSWSGVTCENNHVTALNLTSNKLQGNLPIELINLTYLTSLDLSHNSLSGQLPTQIGQLANLKTLMLNNNQLEGEIPTALLFLGLLQSLDISYNKFTATALGITTWLNKLNPSWAQTQTTPPLNLQVTLMPTGTIRLTWQPISYTTNNGYYEISYATAITSNYIVHGFTTNKSVSSYEITNLKGDNRYYFRIRSYTPAHDQQQNELWSDYSIITFKNTRNIYLPIVQQNEKSTR